MADDIKSSTLSPSMDVFHCQHEGDTNQEDDEMNRRPAQADLMLDFRNKVGCGDIDEVARGKREKIDDRSLHHRRCQVTDYAAQHCR